MDYTLLAQVLTWLFSGPGAGVITFYLMEKIPELAKLSSEAKRYVSLAMASVLAMGAFAGAVGLGYEAAPQSAQAWIEALFAVAFVSTGLSQVLHGRSKLRS
jgi:hypothetical protein